jgi:hypothetical protein
MEVTAMEELYAQGDLLIERVADRSPSGTIVPTVEGRPIILAQGEASGHSHALYDGVTMFRDDRLARDIPTDLYVGHFRIEAPSARLQHEEHGTLMLPEGTYRVRRQREFQPQDARIVVD